MYMHTRILVAQTVNNPPAIRETWVGSLGWEDPLGKGTATHSSILTHTHTHTHTHTQRHLAYIYMLTYI